MDARRRPSPESIADARAEYLAIALSMSGDFDVAIKKIQEERVLLEATQVVVRTVAEAAQIKHEALEYAAGRKAAGDSLLDEAKATKALIDGQRQAADTMVAEAEAQKAATQTGWVALERDRKSFDAACAKRTHELDQRERLIVDKEQAAVNMLAEAKLSKEKLDKRLQQLAAVS